MTEQAINELTIKMNQLISLATTQAHAIQQATAQINALNLKQASSDKTILNLQSKQLSLASVHQANALNSLSTKTTTAFISVTSAMPKWVEPEY
jgi:hypothetical protein